MGQRSVVMAPIQQLIRLQLSQLDDVCCDAVPGDDLLGTHAASQRRALECTATSHASVSCGAWLVPVLVQQGSLCAPFIQVGLPLRLGTVQLHLLLNAVLMYGSTAM